VNLLPGVDQLKMNIIRNEENVDIDLDVNVEVVND
jgi:hypothetical protein